MWEVVEEDMENDVCFDMDRVREVLRYFFSLYLLDLILCLFFPFFITHNLLIIYIPLQIR
jgi:hypothetical protein